MGYRIIYFDERRKNRLRRILLSLVFFTLFLIWTMQNWGEGRSFVLEVLFPVSGSEAEDAINVMLMELEEGRNVRESIAAFIHTVFPSTAEHLY